nr:MAG TPA: hypothetical protein [Caudoviricetes sp.]
MYVLVDYFRFSNARLLKLSCHRKDYYIKKFPDSS